MFAWHDTPWMWLSMVAFWSVFAVFAHYAIKAMTGRGDHRPSRRPRRSAGGRRR